MEIRQILMVALFMFAAAIMKSAMPGQMPVEVSNNKNADENGQIDSAPMLTALAPATDLVLTRKSNPVPTSITPNATLHGSGFETSPIPGSFIALVVAAMALVSVARRPV